MTNSFEDAANANVGAVSVKYFHLIWPKNLQLKESKMIYIH
jgi:hypothetical protein